MRSVHAAIPPAVAVVIGVLLPPRPAIGQTLAQEVGYVDVQRISEESQEATAANETLEALRNERNDEIARQREALQAEQEKLLASEAVLGAEARDAQVRLVQRLQVDLQRLIEDAQAELQRLQRELEAGLREKLLPAVLFVARERELKLVLRRDDPNLLWADPMLDITDAVMARMDAPRPPASGAPGSGTPPEPSTPPAPAAPPEPAVPPQSATPPEPAAPRTGTASRGEPDLAWIEEAALLPVPHIDPSR